MKQILTIVFKGFLILTLLALAVLLVFGLVLWIGWPWWVGFFMLVMVIGLILGLVVLRKVLGRRREQMFVHQVIAQDESMYQSMALQEKDTAKELQARWKEAIEALRKSHLRKFGNPLYVLPWYMVIGESGSGKTTAIQSAKLSSPFAEVSRTSGISGTRNCDWWFFEQAIIIDTAGRYALRVDEARDKEEWQKFLILLSKFRKKEPLNGLVVTVAADRLAQGTPEALSEDGRNIRKRIEELTRVLGARSPVYVMVTKSDLVQGATQFCDQLPEAALNQALGYLNQQLNTNAGAVVDQAMRTIGDRLRELRLLLLQKSKDPSTATTMLLFPEEFEKLKDNLSAFVNSAFQENPYQETPLLRGIFFSSGRQEGTPFSHFLSALGLIQAREMLQGTNRGLFLHDFFAKILPTDRNLFRPTQHMQEWNKLTRNMGLTAWIAFMVALCGLLSYSFVKNLSALSDVRREFKDAAVLQGDLLPDVITMDRFRKAVIKVEERNENWWIPRLGLNESRNLESKLKQQYVRLFRDGFMQPFDKSIGERMTRFNWSTPSGEFGAHVAHLVRRINLLKARLAQEGLVQLGEHPLPTYNTVVLGGTEVIPEVQKNLATDYLYAIAWEQDANKLNTELTHLQTWLKHLLTLDGVTLNWLADWVNADPDLDAVTLYDFWGGDMANDEVSVPPAFTDKGKLKIDQALTEIEAALFDPLIIGNNKIDFFKWYFKRYHEVWAKFAQSFDAGIDMLKERGQWQVVAKRLPTDIGPYFGLIRRITEEYKNFDTETPIPAWAGLSYDYMALREEAKETKTADGQTPGLLRKATSKVKSKIGKAERAFGVRVRSPLKAEDQLRVVKAVAAYQDALNAMVGATGSRNVAFEMASALYQQDPAVGDSPFYIASRSVREIKTLMADMQDEQEAIFWHLLEGNERFMLKYVNQETACHLQSLWEKEVLLEVQDVSADTDIAQIMMGGDGYGTRFIKGSAGPFIARSLTKGYYAKKALETEIRFSPEFLAYLSKGAEAARPAKSSYNVKIRAYPTDTNRGAQLQPHATVLELQCGDGNTRLENFNYPVAKTFSWAPNSCGDVIFQISVGTLVLTKTYTGHHAFAKFLHDFKTGSRTFGRDEFPSDEAALRRMGIQYIKAKYQFQGQKEALALLYRAPGKPPREIVPCWE